MEEFIGLSLDKILLDQSPSLILFSVFYWRLSNRSSQLTSINCLQVRNSVPNAHMLHMCFKKTRDAEWKSNNNLIRLKRKIFLLATWQNPHRSARDRVQRFASR